MGAEKHPDDKIRGEDRTDAPDSAAAERYPPTEKDDSIDPAAARRGGRSFDGAESKDSLDNPQPRQGADDAGPSRPSDPTLDQSAAKR